MSDAVIRHYGDRLRQLSEQEHIGPFDRTAVASMLETACGWPGAAISDGAIPRAGGLGSRSGVYCAARCSGTGERLACTARAAKRESSGTTSPKRRFAK